MNNQNADLFEDQSKPTFENHNTAKDKSHYVPLAARMRPKKIEDYVGQSHIIKPGLPLYDMAHGNCFHSMILWGAPGIGKTTLAEIIAQNAHANFQTLSAVLSGVSDIRAAIRRADAAQKLGKRSILFVDEVHRFNKAQQDAFLPFIEKGTFTFIGATTENPSFTLNNALLSRARVYILKPLGEDALSLLLDRALNDDINGLGKLNLSMPKQAKSLLIQAACSDARKLLNLLEMAADFAESGVIETSIVEKIITQGTPAFDRGGDLFYDQLSAFHKSIRGSSAEGALYWFARMVEGGASPLTIVRRLIAAASEDIGNADPRALDIALNAHAAFECLGSPEGFLAISQAIVYCATAPKSNAVYRAMKKAFDDAKNSGTLPVPMRLRNAPNKLMKSMGCGKAYRYAHDEPHAYAAGECYLPEQLSSQKYYVPSERGFEKVLSERLNWLYHLDQKAN